MDRLNVKDKYFTKFIDNSKILEAMRRIAQSINDDYRKDIPVFIGVLNGSFMFAADLLKKIEGECEISFIAVASYKGTKTTGIIEKSIELKRDIKDRRVIILEDIIDTGITIKYLIAELEKHEPKDVKVATLLLKPAALQIDYKPDYTGIEIPNEFIVGYGLDYNGFGRNYQNIYKISEG